jgi:RHS repeat-associated protein
VTGVNTTARVLSFVHTDHLGRPIRMTSAAKATVWQASYKPFGEVQALSGTIEQNLRFPGQYFLIEGGLAYNWHRFYDPSTGRYTQADPLRFVDGPGLYAYAGGSPWMRTDRNGGKTTIIITRDFGIGGHAALYITDNHAEGDSNGTGNMLHDPAGQFDCGCGGMGSGDAIWGDSTPSLDKYIRFHEGLGSAAELYSFDTSSKDEKRIIDKVEKAAGAAHFFCANGVASVIFGIGPFENLSGGLYITPGSLADLLKGLPNVMTNVGGSGW